MVSFNYIITIVISLFSLAVFSQVPETDSISDALKLQIKQADSDTLKINLKLDLAGRMALFNLDTAVVIVKDVEKQIEKFNKNSAFYKQTKFTILRSYSSAEIIKENLANALEYQLQATNYSLKTKDSTNLALSYKDLGIIYKKLGDLSNAERYFRLALKIQERHSIPEQFSKTHHNLGYIYVKKNRLDSALIMFEKAKKIDTSRTNIITAESNIATVYKAQGKYDKALIINKKLVALSDPKNYVNLGTLYGNLASTHGMLDDWKNALMPVDSCIYYYMLSEKKIGLMRAYQFKAMALRELKDFEEAYKYQALFKVYSDSVNNVEEHKRIKELELNYKFDKERDIAAIELKNQTSKKNLYIILLVISILASIGFIYILRKNSKQRLALAKNQLELKEVEKLKSELALANRENELKKVVIENSITEEVLNKTLDDIKDIITFQNEKERQAALRSLSLDLLSEKTSHTSASSLQSYIDNVHIDFKILLDSNYPNLTSKDKELIYLMKAGLSSSQISKVLNTTLSAIKSVRYRIRKKLNLSSETDIIAFLDKKAATDL